MRLINKVIDLEQKILALSWKEPYGTLMLPPFNKIETRTWSTKYRGLVLICCSKKAYNLDEIWNISAINTGINIRLQNLGKAIGIGELTDCRVMTPEDEGKCFVSYYPDLFCHIYTNVQKIEPFDFKGKQGFSLVSDGVKKKIKIITEKTD
jgi:hypothetical protein